MLPGTPAQIPACAIHAPGSCLGCLAVNRSTGHGCRTRTFGSHAAASLFAFVHVVSSCWLLRLSARRQRSVTCVLNFRMVGSCPGLSDSSGIPEPLS